MEQHVKRRIYVLEGDPERIAVAISKSSRNPQPFDEILATLTKEDAGKWIGRYVLDHGHKSPAEGAVDHYAIEGISRWVNKATLQARRLGVSFEEKSTRRQQFNPDAFWRDPKIMDSRHAERYIRSIRAVMYGAAEITPELEAYFRARVPRQEKETDRAYARRIMDMTYDVVRYLYPLALLTNEGMTVNGAAIELLLRHMFSSPLTEAREIADELKAVATQRLPTFVKYTDPSPYLIETREALHALASTLLPSLDRVTMGESVRLLEWDRDTLNKVSTALLLSQTTFRSWGAAYQIVASLPQERKLEIFDAALRRRGKFDAPLRALEHNQPWMFEIALDTGSWIDIQRHRILTPLGPFPTVAHGYAVPREIIEIGRESWYRARMDAIGEAYMCIAPDFPWEAPYLVTNAHYQVFVLTMNLREAFHIVELRSGEGGHPSYRRMAVKMGELILEKCPFLTPYLRIDRSNPEELKEV